MEYSLSTLDKNRLSIALDNFNYCKNGSCDYVNSLNKLAYSVLPDNILDIFLSQKASINPLPYIFIDNLPVDDNVKKVPLSHEKTENFKSGHRSENLLIMLSSLIGEPYSMVFEGNEIVNNLIPYRETSYDYTGLGSNVELDFHIENAALKHFSSCNFSPMGLMLTGVNYDPHGPSTRVSDGQKALSKLSKDDIEILKSPFFKIKVPHRWRSDVNGIKNTETEWVSILNGEKDNYTELSAVFYKDMIKSKNIRASKALSRLHKAVQDVSVEFFLKPGQLLYIDNRFTLHSRDNFEPTYINNRPLRWVQRVFVAPNLWGHRNLAQLKDRIYEVKR